MSSRTLLLASASAFAAALVALPGSTASGANWLEMNFYMSGPEYEGKLPPCDYRDALVKIASRFNQKENVYWNTDLRYSSSEIRRDGTSPLGRQYNSASLLQHRAGHGRPHVHHPLFDRRRYRHDRRQLGGWWCVVRLDRNWSYEPTCKMARP